MAQGDLTKRESRLHTAATSPRHRSRTGRYARTEWPWLAALPGCRPSYSPDTYSSGAVQQAAKVEQGVVAGIRKVAVSPDGTLGGTAGAAAGGIGGAQAPGGGVRTALTALGGSVVGGLVGSGIERATGEVAAFEYIVRKGNGELVSVTQRDPAPLALGQRVLVIAGA